MKLLLTTVSLDTERGSGPHTDTYLAHYLMRAGVECTVVTMEDAT